MQRSSWHEWLLIWGYDINGPEPSLDDASCREVAWNLIGDRTIPVTITGWSTWTVNHMHATCYHSGRVFCMGDAVR